MFKLHTCINVVLKAHLNGPFMNLKDRKVLHFTGVPLIKLNCSCNPTLRGRGQLSELTRELSGPHQESWSSVWSKSELNKHNFSFDRNLGFVSKNTELVDLPENLAIDMDNANTYLKAAEAIARSGRHNYEGLRIRLTSGFDWTLLKHNIDNYHDKQLVDYIRFGFPLNIDPTNYICSNAMVNHASANKFPEAVSEYIDTELKHGALIGPFDNPPHGNFTWSPLMTRPKEKGRRVILDLSYGDNSVNKATSRDHFDNVQFQLKLPNLDVLIPHLERLGSHARLFKVDISRAFRNIRIDPADSLHLGIYWQDRFYLDRNLPFGAVHGTAIFQRIMDFIRFLMAQNGFTVYNYIDDMYACIHADKAQEAFKLLQDIIVNLGLPLNENKVLAPAKSMSIMGILVDVDKRTFSIPREKLDEIYDECARTMLKSQLAKKELQSLLGKLLYISCCVQGCRTFMNRMLQTLRDMKDADYISPSESFFRDLAWFVAFLYTFNGVVYFRRDPVSVHAHVDATLVHLGGPPASQYIQHPYHEI